VRRAADAGRVEEALHGMGVLVRMGEVESQTLGMVGSAAVKGGKVRGLVDVVYSARDALRGRPALQLAILHSIMSSVTLHCVVEDEHLSELVQVLTDVTEFTEGEHFRVYYRRIATGLLHEYVDEARAALERSRTVAVDALERFGTCHANITCQPGQKAGEVKCSLPFGSGGGEERRGISGGDVVAFTPFPTVGYDLPIEAEVAVVLSREIVVKVPDKTDYEKLMAPGRRWRMDKTSNKVAYVRQLKALRIICGSASGGVGGGGGGGKGKKGGRSRPADEIVIALTTPVSHPGHPVPRIIQVLLMCC